MTTDTTRRALIGTGAAVAAAAAVPAEAATADPTLDLIAAHRKACQELKRADRATPHDDDLLYKLVDIAWDLKTHLLTEPATTRVGLLTKLRYLRSGGEMHLSDGNIDEHICEFVDMLIASIDRLA